MAQPVPLAQVKPSFDKEKVVLVCNPTAVDFKTKFAGEEVVLKSGAMRQFTETKGAHIAKHLAIFILHNQSVRFLQKTFPGLTEKGQPKWKMQSNSGFFTKADILDLAQTFVVYDYEPGDEVPELPEVQTKFDNPEALDPSLQDEGKDILSKPSKEKTGEGKPENSTDGDKEKGEEVDEDLDEEGEKDQDETAENKGGDEDKAVGATSKPAGRAGGKPANAGGRRR